MWFQKSKYWCWFQFIWRKLTSCDVEKHKIFLNEYETKKKRGGTFDITTLFKAKCLSDEQNFRKEKHEAP